MVAIGATLLCRDLWSKLPELFLRAQARVEGRVKSRGAFCSLANSFLHIFFAVIYFVIYCLNTHVVFLIFFYLSEDLSRPVRASRATEEEKLLAFVNRIIGFANDLTEAGIACKLSVAFGKFTFNLDTTRLAKSPSRKGKSARVR